MLIECKEERRIKAEQLNKQLDSRNRQLELQLARSQVLNGTKDNCDWNFILKDKNLHTILGKPKEI